MPSFLLLVFVLALLVAALYGLAYVDGRTIVRNLRRITGVAMLIVAGFLVIVGRWVLALPLAYFAVSILMRGGWSGFAGRARKSPGQRSRVRRTSVGPSIRGMITSLTRRSILPS